MLTTKQALDIIQAHTFSYIIFCRYGDILNVLPLTAEADFDDKQEIRRNHFGNHVEFVNSSQATQEFIESKRFRSLIAALHVDLEKLLKPEEIGFGITIMYLKGLHYIINRKTISPASVIKCPFYSILRNIDHASFAVYDPNGIFEVLQNKSTIFLQMEAPDFSWYQYSLESGRVITSSQETLVPISECQLVSKNDVSLYFI